MKKQSKFLCIALSICLLLTSVCAAAFFSGTNTKAIQISSKEKVGLEIGGDPSPGEWSKDEQGAADGNPDFDKASIKYSFNKTTGYIYFFFTNKAKKYSIRDCYSPITPDAALPNWQTWLTDATASYKKLELKSKVKNVGSGAFMGALGLTEIIFSADISNISQYAFYGCDNIKTITYNGTALDWENVVIAENNGILNMSISEMVKNGITFNCNSPKGDVDGNGVVDTSDAQLLADCIAKNTTLSDNQIYFADMNGDGLLDVNDCVLVLKAIS